MRSDAPEPHRESRECGQCLARRALPTLPTFSMRLYSVYTRGISPEETDDKDKEDHDRREARPPHGQQNKRGVHPDVLLYKLTPLNTRPVRIAPASGVWL